jgi:uncharacterized protein YodC (DUF2158 family)
MSFAQGDTVNVKSGGPALTVLSVDGDQVKCLFFSEELGDFRETVIPAFALEAFDEDDDTEEVAEADDEEHEDEDEDEDEDGERHDEDDDEDKAA